MNHDGDSFLPLIPSTMEHTNEQAFCPVNPTYPCHKDIDLIAPIAQAVQESLITSDEAIECVIDRTLQGGGWA